MAFQLGIIGGGNMGAAIAAGAVEHGVLDAQSLVVAELDDSRRRLLAERGLTTTPDPAGVLGAEQIMLAVKPQHFAAVARAIGPLAEPRVVISIMAGLASGRIRAALGSPARVIRAMPNTPSRIGAGITAIAPGDGAEAGDERLAVRIFEALGRTVMVREEQMHAVTAVSGSGPAYFFLLAEAIEQAATDLGLDAGQAALLVRHTILGAGRLLVESADEPAALRRAVTSPGGTTEAALRVLLDRDFRQLVHAAVTAARDRGVELAGE